MLKDFEKRFAQAQQRHDRIAHLAMVWIAIVWLVISGLLLTVGYLLVTTSPEELGSFFGRIVAGFRSAA